MELPSWQGKQRQPVQGGHLRGRGHMSTGIEKRYPVGWEGENAWASSHAEWEIKNPVGNTGAGLGGCLLTSRVASSCLLGSPSLVPWQSMQAPDFLW